MRFFLLSSLLLVACGEQSIDFKPQKISRNVFRSTTLSTFQGADEIPGTKTKIWYQETLDPQGEIISFERNFTTDASVGYHKQSLPTELSFRQKISASLSTTQVLQVSGFSKFFKDVVPKLNLPKVFETEIKNNFSPATAKQEFSLWWQASHIPTGTYDELQNITTTTKASLQNKLWTVDSVKTEKVQKIDAQRCLKWDIYYRRNLPQNHYLFEQMGAADSIAKEEYKDFKWDSAKTNGKLSVYNDIKNGRLCRMIDWQEQENIIKHKETGEARSFRSNLHTETLYTYE